jgi:phosphoribosylglycinamide formyltransferase-1
LNICVLASGRGSNLNSIVKSQKNGKFLSKIALVISNNSNSNALNIARANQIPAVHLSMKLFPDYNKYTEAFINHLVKYKVDFIVLAGYMKLLPIEIVRKYKNRIINIHPALLPSFGGKGMYGMNVHSAVINYGVKYSGATVHIVNDEYDSGPIVLQKTVRVKDDDTPETLQKKILKQEHKILPEAIKLFESKTVVIKDRKVIFK